MRSSLVTLLLILLVCGCQSDSSSDPTGATGNGGATAPAANRAPAFVAPGRVTIAEDSLLVLQVTVDDPDGDPMRVLADDLPPGARWDEAARQLHFRPDFIQGGDTFFVRLRADDGQLSSHELLELVVLDTIAPPWPTVTSTTSHSNHERLRLSQTTDAYLDSPGYAGRSFTARVVVPTGADANNRMPVRVYLHGFGGAPYTGGAGGQFRIYAHDSMNSYWYGYGDSLPAAAGPTSGTVPNYTQRRVLHLLEWVLRNFPGADPERVYVVGGSMGGAGAATLGFLYARHFCYVHATIGQKIPANHRPARKSQLEGLWGSAALNLDDAYGEPVWDRQDLTQMLAGLPEARNQFVFTKHGKDDPTIHFGAVVHASPATGLSFYESLQAERIGHYSVWDEGGHGSDDPVLGGGWFDRSFSFIFDSTTYLRRDLPFPAFTGSSLDDDPGDGSGNGQQSWNATKGYAGSVGTAGDTGWTGDVAGAINRFFRWDSNAIVDGVDGVSIPLKVVSGIGNNAPAAGYPTTGDQLPAPVPVLASVTVRRTRFVCLPGETVQWSFGTLSGAVAANPDGSVTVPDLPLEDSYQVLSLSR